MLKNTFPRGSCVLYVLGVFAGLVLLVNPADSSAQVVFDGNLRPENDGLSPNVANAGEPADYQIESRYGIQSGGNLFHSFSTFSIGSGESATFSGPVGLDNIIGAVTGPEISDIQGSLGSTVVGADLWLINPNGVVFGEDARLEVKGGFHVSTADHLTFPGGAIFSATQPASNTLVAADPVSFGFLDAAVGSIVSNGALLAVPAAEGAADIPLLETSDFTIAGGEIRLSGSGADAPESERVFVGTQVGDIRIASVASAGELPVESLDTTAFETLGDIRVDEGLIVSSSGVTPVELNTILAGGSGSIQIVGNDLTLADAQILSRTSVGGRNAGSIDVALRNAFRVQSTGGSLLPGIQNVTAPVAGQLVFGSAEGIRVHAATVELGPGTELSSSTAQFGDGGPIEISAEESIRLTGAGASRESRAIIFSNSDGEGRAGSVRLAAPTIELASGGAIIVESRGKLMPQATPESEGNIIIGESSDGRIATDRLVLREDARIDGSTRDLRPGGTIDITTRESVLISGAGQTDLTGITSLAQPESTATGSGGAISIQTPSLVLEDGAAIAARSFGNGDAGSVSVVANSIEMTGHSEIATESVRTAGGNISIDAVDLLLVRDSQITTSVRTGSSPGGNIEIDPTFVVLDHGQIVARADAGKGGNITIVADFFLADEASVVSASSNVGLDGQVVIRSPIVDLSAELEGLPERVGVTEALLREQCAAAGGRGGSGSFVVVGRETLRRSPDAPLVDEPRFASESADVATSPPSPTRPTGDASGPTLFAIHCGDVLRTDL